MPVPTLIERIRSEYLALPGLKLTLPQARRLWPASDEVFDAAFAALLADGFLRRLPSGAFVALPERAGSSLKAALPDAALEARVRCPHCHKLNPAPDLAALAARAVRCVACRRLITARTA